MADKTGAPDAIVKLTFEISKKIFPAPSTFTLAIVVVTFGTVIVTEPLFGNPDKRV